jgi:hypothetical protein
MMVRCAGANPSKVMRGSTAAYLRTGKQLDAFFNVLESLMTVWRMTAPSKSQMGIPISSRRAYLKEQIGLEIYKRKTHILVEFRTPRDGFAVPLTTVSHVWRRCMHVYLPDETPTTNVEFHITFGKGDKE